MKIHFTIKKMQKLTYIFVFSHESIFIKEYIINKKTLLITIYFKIMKKKLNISPKQSH